ncbi:MerC domain-containing protein [Sphingomonas morindae]|uniref:MerC domain-containing protein n=1 Tax=Sphingomonas morindae TaxID=1541170 RepID=A0ABY4X4T5_9SPHN|nr:MerC domain-containing protein [Sphingomonas morindae]USI71899.1 MerC domain-containing protein [Sphingomonas morindae]
MGVSAERSAASARVAGASRLDRLAIGLSGLCLVHCVATVLLAASLASLGAALANPAYHEVGFALAVLFGAIALGRGFRAHRDRRPLLLGGAGLVLMAAGLVVPHGLAELACTMAGVTLLAIAHRLNARPRGLVEARPAA